MRKQSLLTVLLCVVPSLAAAEAQRPAAGINEAVERLDSDDVDTVVAAIQELGGSGASQAVAPLITLLQGGPPDVITHEALQALGALGQTSAIDILVEYTHHRRSEARIFALESLSGMRDPRVEAALVEALRDSVADVRSTAATALGQGGYSDSVPILFQAFDRGVREACVAIGQLGDSAAAERLAGYLGRGDLPTLLEGFQEFMIRTQFDVDSKVMIVHRLLDLAGPQVRRFLVSVLTDVPNNAANRQLRTEMEAAIAQIPEE